MPEFTEASDALQQSEQSLSDSACVRTFKAHATQVHDIHTIRVSLSTGRFGTLFTPPWLCKKQRTADPTRQRSISVRRRFGLTVFFDNCVLKNVWSAVQVGDEELIASASADASVRIWSASLHNPAAEYHLKHKDQVLRSRMSVHESLKGTTKAMRMEVGTIYTYM